MNQSSANRGFPAGNPIANALVIIVGALAIGASLVLGFVVFVALTVFLVVLAAIIGIRMWWFNRKLRKSGATATVYGAEKRGPMDLLRASTTSSSKTRTPTSPDGPWSKRTKIRKVAFHDKRQ